MRPTYSLVIPVFDEEAGLVHLYAEVWRLMERLDGPTEVVFVDDGSRDGSLEVLHELRGRDPRCKVVELSRNFGHQVAVSAGLDHARGEAAVVMDADLQDPPEVVLEMARRWREGYEVVFGVRVDRASDSWFKRTTAGAFYRLIGRAATVDLPAEVGDFRLVDRAALDAFRGMGERNRYVRGMFAWVGFRQIGVPYVRPERQDGETHYTVAKMLRLAEDALVGFSQAPLRAVLSGGLGLTAVGAGTAVALAGARRLGVRTPAAGLPLAALAVACGAQVTAIGVVGQYVGRTYDEAIDRPLYVVRATAGFDDAATTAIAGPTLAAIGSSPDRVLDLTGRAG